MLKSSVLEQIDSLPHLKRGTLPLPSVWSLRDDKRETVLRPGLLAQLAERGADNAKVVSSSLTWTKIGETGYSFPTSFTPTQDPVSCGNLLTVVTSGIEIKE